MEWRALNADVDGLERVEPLHGRGCLLWLCGCLLTKTHLSELLRYACHSTLWSWRSSWCRVASLRSLISRLRVILWLPVLLPRCWLCIGVRITWLTVSLLSRLLWVCSICWRGGSRSCTSVWHPLRRWCLSSRSIIGSEVVSLTSVCPLLLSTSRSRSRWLLRIILLSAVLSILSILISLRGRHLYNESRGLTAVRSRSNVHDRENVCLVSQRSGVLV